MKVTLLGLKALDAGHVSALISEMEEGDLLAYGIYKELTALIPNHTHGIGECELREVQAISDVIAGMIATNSTIGVCLFEDNSQHFHFGNGDFEYSFNPAGDCDYEDNFPKGYIKITRD